MTTPLLDMSALISHRFRGFAPQENTLDGLEAALNFGVLNLEFDIRMAACGTPMIYHDEWALDGGGKRRLLSDYKAEEYKKLGGRFTHIPTFENLLTLFKNHKNKRAKLFIDIKDLGFETLIHALVMGAKVGTRIIYVSWIPEILYRMQTIAPNIPKVISHWCMNISPRIRENHISYTSADGKIERRHEDYVVGERSGYLIIKPIRGKMLALLKQSKGGICVPKMMLTKELSGYYHDHNLKVFTFSYIDWDSINTHKSALDIDLYFIDNKNVFDKLF
ncbi:MAG: glycerophosphodiester phosphodiesterase family protein [Robiginitomaculum sp.]